MMEGMLSRPRSTISSTESKVWVVRRDRFWPIGYRQARQKNQWFRWVADKRQMKNGKTSMYMVNCSDYSFSFASLSTGFVFRHDSNGTRSVCQFVGEKSYRIISIEKINKLPSCPHLIESHHGSRGILIFSLWRTFSVCCLLTYSRSEKCHIRCTCPRQHVLGCINRCVNIQIN